MELLLTTPRFQVVRHSMVLGDGRSIQREVVLHPGAVGILPLLDEEQLVLIRNQRVAVGQTLWEIPAGTLEAGEAPQDCARRELREETGYHCETLDRMTELWMSPGILRERMHLFVARGLTGGEASPEPGEELQTVVTSLSQAMQWIKSGEIADAKTVAAVLHYAAFRPK